MCFTVTSWETTEVVVVVGFDNIVVVGFVIFFSFV